jgi:putative ABC transport system ATP-binding protein
MTTVDVTSERGSIRTIGHALTLAPEFKAGLPFTLLLTLISTAGRVVVPLAVQQTIDHGLSGPEPDFALVRTACLLAFAAVALTAVANYAMNVRLYRTTENGLLSLRTQTFRRVHDLSVLHQATEQRGSLVSRVTGDVDTMSSFMQFGGLLIVISTAQVLLATALMLWWSWQLTLVVYVCMLPLALSIRVFQRKLQIAYRGVRERIGAMLAAVSESVVGAPVIRAYGAQARTAQRIDEAIAATNKAQTKAQAISATTFCSG